MRGRPARELLRRYALPTAAAVVLVVVPAAAAAGAPSPDRAPAVPATLAPDPVPGTSQAPPRPVTAPPTTTQPAYVAPVVAHAAPAPVKHAAVVHHARKRTPVAKSKPGRKPKPPVRFALPQIAVPSLAAVAAASSSHDGDAALAGLALLLAAATAGSGARLVSVWSRRT